MPSRTCKHCERSLSVTARANAEFCSPEHRSAWHNKQRRSQRTTDKRLAPASVALSTGNGEIRSLSEARSNPEPFDRDRILVELKARGSAGIHSHEIRKLGLSGHPSMRISELEERGYVIEHAREHKGRRPGVRYTLVAEPEQLSEAA